jgi:hypothetical protein
MPRKQRPIIVHLRVNTNDIGGNFPTYNPNMVDTEPEPVDTSTSLPYDKFTPATNKPIKTGTNTQVIECNSEYKDSKIYPRSSHAVCWWDGHAFDSKPFFIPKDIIENETNQTPSYNVYGNFCSPECAMAHLESEISLDPEVKWERVMLLHEMCKRVYNNTKDRIRASLPRWVLTEYGGGLDIEEYRKACTNTCNECEIIYPPIIVDIPIIKMTNMDSRPKVTEKVIIQEERFLRAENNLSKTVETKPEKKGILELMNIRIENMT